MVLGLTPSHKSRRGHTLANYKKARWHFVFGFFLVPNHLLNGISATTTKLFVPTNAGPTSIVLTLLPHLRSSQFV